MTPRPDAPDWRRLVSEAGAEPSILTETTHHGCMLTNGVYVESHLGAWVFGRPPDAGATPVDVVSATFRFQVLTDVVVPCAGPAEAIHAAINYLRDEMRARMGRDAAALKRLGCGE